MIFNHFIYLKKLIIFTLLSITLIVNVPQVFASSKLYFVHSDHLGTPQVLTDANQKVVWRVESQTPFGVTQVNEDPDGDGQLVEFNLRFPGQYFDKETGTNYNYFRTYDPTLGRYIQSDPIGLNGGINTYGYAYQNPLMNFDTYGLEVEVLIGGAHWYDHAAIRINNTVYSNGRYPVPGSEPSSGGLVGPNVLTKKNASSYYETSERCKSCNTTGYILDVTPQEEAKIEAYYKNVIASAQKHPARSNWWILPDDYYFVGNNCAGMVNDSLKAGLPWYHEMSLPGVATPQTLELNLNVSPFLVEEKKKY